MESRTANLVRPSSCINVSLLSSITRFLSKTWQHHGSTDPIVFLNTLEHHGIPQVIAAPKLGELKTKMVEYAMHVASEVGEGLEVLSGVRDLLEVLSRHEEVVIGLVTRNLEDIAWFKMEGLRIRQFFSVPNFGG